MKKILKKATVYLMIFSILINSASPLFMMNAKAESKPYTIVGLPNPETNLLNLNMDGNSERTISITSENDEYELMGCSNSNRDTIYIKFNNETKTCTIKALSYGKGNVSLNIIKLSEPDLKMPLETITVDIESEAYLDIALAKMPDETNITRQQYEKGDYFPKISLMPGYHGNFTSCETVDSTQLICQYQVSYSAFSGNLSKSKVVTFNISSLGFFSTEIDLIKNNTEKLYLNSSYDGSYDDLIWLSDDYSKVTVDQKGNIKGLQVGSAYVTVYNIKTNEEAKIKINVINKPDEVTQIDNYDTFFEYLGNIKIPINNGNYFYSTYDEEYKSSLNDIVRNFLNSKIYNYSWEVEIPYFAVECDETYSCNVEFKNYEKTIDVQLMGVYLVADNNYLTVGGTVAPDDTPIKKHIKPIAFTAPDQIEWEYDDQILSRDAQGLFTPLKAGITEVKVIATYGQEKYISTITITVNYDYQVKTVLDGYLENNSSLNLPYSDSVFSNSDLSLIENIVASRILKNIPDKDALKDIEVIAKCSNTNNCSAKINVSENGHILLSGNYYPIKIIYDNESSNNGAKIKEINNIMNYHLYSLEESLKIEKECLGGTSECFYDKLIEKLNLDSYAPDGLTYEILNKTFQDLVSNVHGSVSFTLLVKDDGYEILTKNITMKTNLILSIPFDDDATKEVYTKNFIDSVLSVDSTVTLLSNNLYKIMIDSNSFNIIVDKKPITQITNIQFKNDIFELQVGEDALLEYWYFPEEANVIPEVEFFSEDESVATVDENGHIIAVNSGKTYIVGKYKSIYGWQEARVLVLVETSIQDYMNELASIIPSSVTITYGDLMYNTLEQAISSKILNFLYNENEYAFYFRVEESSGKYYAKATYNIIKNGENRTYESDSKLINYVIKGVKVSQRVYYLNVGETVNSNLTFTEGSISNIEYSLSRRDIISYEKGVITALKPGITEVYLYDKLYNYYYTFQVFVNFEEYLAETLETTLENPVVIKANNLTGNIKDDFYNALSRAFPTYELFRDNYPSITCDDARDECSIEGQLANNTTFQKTFSYVIEGIYINNDEVYLLNPSETETLNYTFYGNTAEEVELESLDPAICTVSGNEVTGVSKGYCDVQLKSESGHVNVVTFLVDKDNYFKSYQDKLTNLTGDLEINALPYSAMAGLESDKNNAIDLYYFIIMTAIKEALNLEDDIYIDFDVEELINSGNEINITLYFNYSYSDSANDLYLWYSLEETVSHLLKIKYKDIPDGVIEKAQEIASKVEKAYVLTTYQYLKSLLNNDKEYYRYSGVMDCLDGYSDDFDFNFYARMGEDSEIFSFAGGDLFITYKGITVLSVFSSFEVSLEIRKDENETEEEFVEKIKNTVRDAYDKLMLENTPQPYFAPFFAPVITPSFAPLAQTFSQSGTEVKVEYVFDAVKMTGGYLVEVGNLEFAISAAKMNGTYEQDPVTPPVTPPGSEKIPGDINGDDKVDISDLIVLRRHLAGIALIENSTYSITDLIDLRKILAN